MSECINVLYNNKPCYDIIIENSWDKLSESCERLNIKNKKICIVTESNVGPLYAYKIRQILEKSAKKVIIYQFPAGEKNKNLNIINEIYEVLIKEKFDRNDMLVAFGGGVTGDMTGFAAATYLRGIQFIQIPTSLLAQVDSSIGGKTGVDFKGYKNMVGAFKQPALVYINTETLKSLNNREFISGMGEVIKYGFIKDKDFFDWLSQNITDILNLDDSALEYIISKSCHAKKIVVENDFTEKGERATLNFGHTIGHAIEKIKDFSLLHGECVAIGMKAALYISLKKNMITEDEFNRGVKIISDFKLPISTSDISAEDVLEATMHDKKMDSGVIKFILINGIGNAIIDRTVTQDEMSDAIKNVLE
ncbi:MAG: 3-dehydroquinate synthase [Lachnospiraceae bacterium]|nr:3-dehydroquinate synthase [Lachnospiraceae bacterium]